MLHNKHQLEWCSLQSKDETHIYTYMYVCMSTCVVATGTLYIIQYLDCSQMAAGGSSDPLPYVRSWQVDPYPVLKVLIWPSKVHGIHAAILTSHGCWVAQLSTDPSIQPSKSVFSHASIPAYMHAYMQS